ncbi:hypothetical protein AB0M22_18115 [Nocardia sp. NPDC051756]|uniref:hypothetical protein n=1 Tax=Nocardia sp. NPDC051756 TaxID=3154751 RepID=UPI00343811A5
MSRRSRRAAKFRRTWRKFVRIAIHLTPGFYAIGWGYHIDASMVDVSHRRRDLADQARQRNGPCLSATERESWRALEKSLKSAR